MMKNLGDWAKPPDTNLSSSSSSSSNIYLYIYIYDWIYILYSCLYFYNIYKIISKHHLIFISTCFHPFIFPFFFFNLDILETNSQRLFGRTYVKQLAILLKWHLCKIYSVFFIVVSSNWPNTGNIWQPITLMAIRIHQLSPNMTFKCGTLVTLWVFP